MNPKYVVSPVRAKQLKDLGFPQESVFFWHQTRMGIELRTYFNGWLHYFDEELQRYQSQFDCEKYPHQCETWSAPHLGELSEWLVKLNATTHAATFFNETTKLWCLTFEEENFSAGLNFDSEFEQDVKAKLLIYLAKEKMIDPKKLL